MNIDRWRACVRLIFPVGRSRARGLVVAVALGLLAAACAEGISIPLPQPRQADIERTWSRAFLALPPAQRGGVAILGQFDSPAIKRRLETAGLRTRLPVVIYLHGCTGIENGIFMRALAEEGYAVVAPNSFARTFRPLQCDPGTRTGGRNRFIYDFRLAELTYALERLDDEDWVDFDNLFLIGTSEGAVAAALFRGDVFNARVITQWTCTGAPLIEGLWAPVRTPVLAIVRANDPYYDPANTVDQTGDCGQYMGARPGSLSIVLNGDRGHGIFEDPGVPREIFSFLATYRVP